MILDSLQHEADSIDNIIGFSAKLITKDKFKLFKIYNYHIYNNFKLFLHKGYHYSNPIIKFNANIINATMDLTMFGNISKNSLICFTPEFKNWLLKDLTTLSVCN